METAATLARAILLSKPSASCYSHPFSRNWCGIIADDVGFYSGSCHPDEQGECELPLASLLQALIVIPRLMVFASTLHVHFRLSSRAAPIHLLLLSSIQPARCRVPRYIATKVEEVHTTWDLHALCNLQNGLKRALNTIAKVIEDARVELVT